MPINNDETISPKGTDADQRPLLALLSQTLVAFTLELDYEFERRMGAAGFPGAILSRVVWQKIVRFLETGASVHQLSEKSASGDAAVFMLGCLERWHVIKFQPGASGQALPRKLHPRAGRLLRDGWGSSRGIRDDWIVALTDKGSVARDVWLPLTQEMESRWVARYGSTRIRALRQSLARVTNLPATTDIATLMASALKIFTRQFNASSDTPLALCASTLRVLSSDAIPEREIPALTGSSIEQCGIGWQHKPYVQVERDSVRGRGKLVRLTDKGLEAQRHYWQLVRQIEADWKDEYGENAIHQLKKCLQELFTLRDGENLLMSVGLTPPSGVVRSGTYVPALGRKTIAAAARKRAREMALQTEAFVRDPARALPHYPLWDMNRGFGP